MNKAMKELNESIEDIKKMTAEINQKRKDELCSPNPAGYSAETQTSQKSLGSI